MSAAITRTTTTTATAPISRGESRHAAAVFTLLVEGQRHGKKWLRNLIGGRDIREVPAGELIGVVGRLERARERELVITNLYVVAPDPLPGDEWWDALLGGRALAYVPTSELVGIVANLEAAAA